MKALAQRIPPQWRRALYVVTGLLAAGLIAAGIVAPDEFSAQVEMWVKLLGEVTALVAAIIAAFNVKPSE